MDQISPPSLVPLSGHEIDPIFIDAFVANANLFATQAAVIATITAIGNTNRALAILDELMSRNTLDMLATTASNSDDDCNANMNRQYVTDMPNRTHHDSSFSSCNSNGMS